MSNPPKPTPAWSTADFDCGDEPEAPPQETVKARVESYQTDALAWGRGCKVILKARGADAVRYDLIPKGKTK